MSSETIERPVESAPARWVRCAGCGAVLYARRISRELGVCPECGHHHRLTADERIRGLLDEGSVVELDHDPADGDPLGFTDTVAYPARRAAARAKTGLREAVVCVRGRVEGRPVVLAVMDFRFLGGSLSGAVGELITRAGEEALRRREPFVIVSASGGARMQEGPLSLMQMAKTSELIGRLDAAGVLVVSIVTDPTFGGVAASYATLADVIIAEPGARLGFAGPRVIEQTIRRPLPAGFQTAEFLLSRGLIDAVHPRAELRARLASLLAVTAAAGESTVDGLTDTLPGTARRGSDGGRELGAGVRAVEADGVVRDPGALPEVDPWIAVRGARDIARPTAADYLGRICSEFVELRGDRLGKDCPAVLGGIGLFDGAPVMVIGIRKGHTAAELGAADFGMASPAGYRKAARLMRLAAKLDIPVITLIDTPGAAPGLEAEENGQAYAISDSIRLMAGLPVPTVAVITGEGGSGGALALATADRVLMFAGAVYSVISAEGCAAILFGDASLAPDAARALRVDARQLLELGIVDGVIPEPDGGTQSDHDAAARALRAALTGALRELRALDKETLTRRRHTCFRSFAAD
ncbi:acetyl-CoA carboxylase, carboxyltransferase subunit beta [Actinokineospora enzanensis]|uniref:acetyl-CoA carboxylase, carboxyltransferase subunit beta n=1 Tax=Actinokineospora enzanensis TaxID=155975 RepID=UPI00035F1794|nr:acetyl-CoA carboxylase, carboxyltransferase subunit beta [Actinokineospora enzanensis]